MIPEITYSIILPVHNKENLIYSVVSSILNTALGSFEFIIIIDGCTDNSEYQTKLAVENWKMAINIMSDSHSYADIKFIHADNIFETKSNNLGASVAKGQFLIFCQDDVIFTQKGWNMFLCQPFLQFNDVFAVSGNCAHNWTFNSNSLDVEEPVSQNKNFQWSDILIHSDHANKTTIQNTDLFLVRQTCNRAPLAIKKYWFNALNGFDEIYYPLDMDDHDLMFRARMKYNLVCGYRRIEFDCRPEWGGTRDSNGQTKPWVYSANQKNTKIFYHRYKQELNPIIQNRALI